MISWLLPEDFPSTGLSAIERRKLDYFYEQFVVRMADSYQHGHFVLACYAALPAVLTPDLVNKLWLNFKNYKWEDEQLTIHPVAPADLLLSTLVEEIGFELYQMAEPVRKAFLLYLQEFPAKTDNRFQLNTVQDVAEFLRDYAQYDFTPENPDDNAFREAQVWTAESYLQPAKAFAGVAKAFESAATNEERVRYKNAIDKMYGRFTLNIVRDKELLPDGFKAMSILTSVVRDIFNNKAPQELLAFQKEVAENEGLLTAEPIVASNVINIEIPAEVSREVAVTGGSHPRKVRGLIVGIAQDFLEPELNAKLFTELVSEMLPVGLADTHVLTGAGATKQAILNVWHLIVKNAGENDDVFFFLSAVSDSNHLIQCYDSDYSRPETWLADEDVGAIAKSSKAASITLILDINAPLLTNHWVNMEQPGNIIFSSYYLLPPPRPETPEIEPSFFTKTLVDLLRETNMQITNRELFIDLLKEYEILDTSPSKKDATWKSVKPEFHCHNSDLDRIFIHHHNSLAELQTCLRQTGCSDQPVSGTWDQETARALAGSITKFQLGENGFKQDYIRALTERKLNAAQARVFLLIFSDPDNKLTEIKREQAFIEKILKEKEAEYNIVVRTLLNPDPYALVNELKKTENRNKIRLLYYSGYDAKGDFMLHGERFSLSDFAALLQFQENLQLVVSNTCRSVYFAEYVAMLGVPLSIGSTDEVLDYASAKFGQELFSAITEQANLVSFVQDRSQMRFSNDTPSQIGHFEMFSRKSPPGNTEPVLSKIDIKDEEKQTPKKQRLLALSIGINSFGELKSPATNALQFNALLEELYPDADLEAHHIQPIATRQTAFESMRLFLQAQEGDVCLLFYSGLGIISSANHLGDFAFSDDPHRDELLPLSNHLSGLLQGKPVHLVIIADLHGNIHRKSSPLKDLELGPGASFVFLHNQAAVEGVNPTVFGNPFFRLFARLLKEGASNFTYREIYDRLYKTMFQPGYIPQLELYTNPREAENLLFLKGTGKSVPEYLISYDNQRRWVLNAGSMHGIQPSLPFMQTLLRCAHDDTIVSVSEVYPDFSVIKESLPDTGKIYNAQVVQMALAKVKVAFHPEIDESARNWLNNQFQSNNIFFADLVPEVKDAEYIIASTDGRLLLQAADNYSQNIMQPVFDFEHDRFEFMKQMEYIAQWTSVLQFDSRSTAIRKDDLVIAMETQAITGKGVVSARRFENPQRLDLNYTDTYPPVIHIQLLSKQNHYHASVLYLDSNYGIIDHQTYELQPGKAVWVNEGKKELPDISFDENYIRQGKTEIYSYIKIFLSDLPVNFALLQQPSLKFGDSSRIRSIARLNQKEQLQLWSTDWTAITIPIKINNVTPEPSQPEAKPEPEKPLTPEFDFYSEEQIRNLVEKRNKETTTGALMIFQTGMQQTWLVATASQIFILLDDMETRTGDELIMTSFDKEQTLPLHTRAADEKDSGAVRFTAQETWWYYSVKLFPNEKSLTKAVEQLISSNAPAKSSQKKRKK